MNVVEIAEDDAFNPGSDLWVVKNDPQNKWWQELDFKSGFLLSNCLYHSKKAPAPQLLEILEMTEMKSLKYVVDEDFLLIGTSDHFLNKWILIWNKNATEVSAKLEKITPGLKTESIRFFSDSEAIMKSVKARPKTSLTDITFIKNT